MKPNTSVIGYCRPMRYNNERQTLRIKKVGIQENFLYIKEHFFFSSFSLCIDLCSQIIAYCVSLLKNNADIVYSTFIYL